MSTIQNLVMLWLVTMLTVFILGVFLLKTLHNIWVELRKMNNRWDDPA